MSSRYELMNTGDLQREMSNVLADLADIRNQLTLRQAEEKDMAIAAIKEEISKHGITAEELGFAMPSEDDEPRKGKRASPKPMYRMILGNGEEKLWSGRGIAPLEFQAARENGTLEEYLIEQS